MCGGSLEVTEGLSVCECEYCGTQQTLPKAQDDAAASLFNRANNLRYKSEFDKAQVLYEKLVTNYPEDSESYWGLVLCKYGIEYVEDPATLKKIMKNLIKEIDGESQQTMNCTPLNDKIALPA